MTSLTSYFKFIANKEVGTLGIIHLLLTTLSKFSKKIILTALFSQILYEVYAIPIKAF